MASAGKSKGTGEEDKVSRPDKSNTASKGMAERPKGGASGDPEVDEDSELDIPRADGAADPVEMDRARD